MIKLAGALLKAQKEMGGATKGTSNLYFKSKYADYGAVLEVVKEPLNNNGILVLQPHCFQDGKSVVETRLVHAESGESISSFTEVVCKEANNPQALGSAITYARRYGLQSLLSIPTEDDDGNAGSGKQAPVKAQPQAAKPTMTAEFKPEAPKGSAAPPHPFPGKLVPESKAPVIEIKKTETKASSPVAAKISKGW